jgi:hypothetical protein
MSAARHCGDRSTVPKLLFEINPGHRFFLRWVIEHRRQSEDEEYLVDALVT